MTFRDFITSPLGLGSVLILRMILASLCICGGIDLFDFKKPSPFFTFKRLIGSFLLILGLRILISSMFFSIN